MIAGFSYVAPNLLEQYVATTASNQLSILTIDRPKPEEVINFNRTVSYTDLLKSLHIPALLCTYLMFRLSFAEQFVQQEI